MSLLDLFRIRTPAPKLAAASRSIESAVEKLTDATSKLEDLVAEMKQNGSKHD